jgi:WD40 repeat protein
MPSVYVPAPKVIMCLAIITLPMAVSEGQEPKKVAVQSDTILALAWSPDGKWIAGSGFDKTVKIWKAGEWELASTLGGASKTVRSVAFSPNSNLLAAGSDDGSVRIWETKTWKLKQTLVGHGDIPCLAFTPDGTTLAAISIAYLGDNKVSPAIKLWDPSSGTCKRTAKLPGGYSSSMVFSKDGKQLFVANGSVNVIQTETGEVKRTFKPESSYVMHLAMSPDGMRLYCGGGTPQTTEVTIWDLKAEKQIDALKNLDRGLRCLAVSADGKVLAIPGSFINATREQVISKVGFWDLATVKQKCQFEGELGDMESIAFAPDSKSLVCTDHNRVYVLNAATGGKRTVLHTVTRKPIRP